MSDGHRQGGGACLGEGPLRGVSELHGWLSRPPPILQHWPAWPCPEETGWPGLSGLPLGRHSDKELGNPAGWRGRCPQNFPKQVTSS